MNEKMNNYDQINANILKTINPNLKIIKRFESGMSNNTYLVTKDNEFFVFRVPFDNSNLFVDFYDELDCLNKIKSLHIAPQTFFFNTNADKMLVGTKLSAYINGNVFNENDDLQALIIKLKKLHTANFKLHPYNHLQRLTKYEALIPNIDSQYYNIKNIWQQLFDNYLIQFIKYNTHGDIQPNNIIVNNQQEVFLIDWEFNGYNDYIYDISSFGNNNLSLGYKLLQAYHSHLSSSHIIRFLAWSIYQSLQWYLVASYKANNYQQNDFDYQAIKNNYLNNANNYLTLLKNYCNTL